MTSLRNLKAGLTRAPSSCFASLRIQGNGMTGNPKEQDVLSWHDRCLSLMHPYRQSPCRYLYAHVMQGMKRECHVSRPHSECSNFAGFATFYKSFSSV